jgi:hypothetical protein
MRHCPISVSLFSTDHFSPRDGKIVVGGSTCRDGDLKYGFYVEPTIVDGLPEGHRVLTEELKKGINESISQGLKVLA